MSDCTFCKIVAGQISAKKLYEDEHAMALLDAFPLVEGHTLVIPKAHYVLLQDMPAPAAQAWFAAVQVVSGALQAAMKADALTIGLNNGKAAGQAVPHVHMHLLPRYASDGGGTLHSIVRQAKQRPLDEVFRQLKKAF